MGNSIKKVLERRLEREREKRERERECKTDTETINRGAQYSSFSRSSEEVNQAIEEERERVCMG